jgi:iron complex transport system ATP-binding protein
MNLIETQQLTIGYGDKPLLDKINFALKPQQICCLLGANGAGKSTFLKTLLGLQPALNGQILFQNRPLATYSAAELAREITYVPQAHAQLFPFLVQDMVLMGRSAYLKWYQTPKAEDKDLALAALEELQITHLAKRYYHELSGGEKQLVLIARAIAQQAKLLIMSTGSQHRIGRQFSGIRNTFTGTSHHRIRVNGFGISNHLCRVLCHATRPFQYKLHDFPCLL